MDLLKTPLTLGAILRKIALAVISLVAGWALGSVTQTNLRTTVLDPAIRIGVPVLSGDQCSFKIWTPRQTYEKVEVTTKTSCERYVLCESDPCPEGIALSKTVPLADTALKLARIPETRMSGGLARRLLLQGCSMCPEDVYVSTNSENGGWSSLLYQKHATRYWILIATLAALALLVLGSMSSSLRSIGSAVLSLRRLTKSERRAWKVDRLVFAHRDLVEIAADIRLEVAIWLDTPTTTELREVAKALRVQAASVFPTLLSIHKPRLQRRRSEHSDSSSTRSFIAWCLIREISSSLDRKK